MYDLERIIRECDIALEKAAVNRTIPISINGRITKTLGRFKFNQEPDGMIIPTALEFSKQYIETATDECIHQTILHECAHYIAAVRDPYVYHGHDSYFKEICAELGCYEDKTKAKVDRIVAEEAFLKYTIQCPNCGTIGGYSRMCRTLQNLDKCHCKRCGGRNLTYKQNF